MMLGGFAFESLGLSYADLGLNLNTQWADIPVAQTLNRQQWTGPTSEELSIKGVLFPAEYPTSLAGLKAAAKRGAVMLLVTGNVTRGDIHGLFTVQSITEDRGYIDDTGREWRNAYTIAVKRYGDDVSGAQNISFGDVISIATNLISLV